MALADRLYCAAAVGIVSGEVSAGASDYRVYRAEIRCRRDDPFHELSHGFLVRDGHVEPAKVIPRAVCLKSDPYRFKRDIVGNVGHIEGQGFKDPVEDHGRHNMGAWMGDDRKDARGAGYLHATLFSGGSFSRSGKGSRLPIPGQGNPKRVRSAGWVPS